MIVDLDQLVDVVHHGLAVALVGRRHQYRELVATDPRRVQRLSNHLVQDLARAAQQSVSGGMAPLVVGRLQAVEIGNDDRDRKWPLALQTIELVDVERTVVQFGENIVLAEVFQIGFGLLAGRDVGEGDLHERPVVLVAEQDRKLQMKMYLVAVKRVIDDFAL